MAASSSLVLAVELLSRWSVPLLLVGVPLYAHLRGIKVYESFVAGAAEGLLTAARIAPYLIAMWVAVALLRSSGVVDLLLGFARPLSVAFGVPPEVIPLAAIRPLSGSGSLSLLTEMLHTYGPDSGIGTLASILHGSTETTFYVITVYLGAVGATRARHSLAASLVGDAVGFLAGTLAWRLFLG